MKTTILIHCDFSNEGAEWTERQIQHQLIDSGVFCCYEELDKWLLIWASGEEDGKPVYFTPQLMAAWMADDPEATRLIKAYDGKILFNHPPLDSLTLKPIRRKTVLTVEVVTNERANTCHIVWKRGGDVMMSEETDRLY